MKLLPYPGALRRAGAAACLLVLAPLAWGQAQQRLAGDVVAVTDRTLTLRSPAGQSSTIELGAAPRVTVRLPARWSDIATGSYVGATAAPRHDGTLVAKEVHIFSEAQRGTGEGHYPMATPGDTMTNATVSKVGAAPRSTMTNATVAAATVGPDMPHQLTLTYKGGEKTIEVPDGTPIVKSQPGDRSLLVPGAHVVVYARAASDGNLSAERISVGKDGFVPPI